MSRFLHKKALYSNKDGENSLYWNKEPFYSAQPPVNMAGSGKENERNPSGKDGKEPGGVSLGAYTLLLNRFARDNNLHRVMLGGVCEQVVCFLELVEGEVVGCHRLCVQAA